MIEPNGTEVAKLADLAVVPQGQFPAVQWAILATPSGERIVRWNEMAQEIGHLRLRGRLATITGDPPREERGVAVSDVYVRPDGRQLSALAELLAHGTLSVPIASVRPLEQAAQALREVVAGADGAIVLSLRT